MTTAFSDAASAPIAMATRVEHAGRAGNGFRRADYVANVPLNLRGLAQAADASQGNLRKRRREHETDRRATFVASRSAPIFMRGHG